MHRNYVFSGWNLNLPSVSQGMPFLHFIKWFGLEETLNLIQSQPPCGTWMILVPQHCVLLWEPHHNEETQNKCQKLSREWLRAGELEEVGGELRSFHTFIRLSHNLTAEKLNHDKNWGKRWGCEVALQVLQQIEKNPALLAPLECRWGRKSLLV